MSSILDALNKVEEDRNARAASEDDADAPFVPEAAADALLSSSKKRRRAARRAPSFNWTPYVYAAGGLAVVALIVGLSAGVALLVGRGSHSGAVAVAAAKPAEKASVQAAVTESPGISASEPQKSSKPADAQAIKPPEKQHETGPIPVEAKPEAKAVSPEPKPKPEEKAVRQTDAPPVPSPAVEAKASEPEPVKAVAEKPAVKPAAAPVKLAKAAPSPAEEPTMPLPSMEAIDRARAVVTEAKPPATVPMHDSPTSFAPGRAAEKRAPLVEDVDTLPRLGQTERERLGLGEMRLNVLREASASQPEGLAIINLKKVYVGEMIPGTNARLIAVRTRVIAIEIEGTGERFKVMN
jgi:hypothetical protein